MNKWLNKALTAADEAREGPVVDSPLRTNSADRADSHLTALTTLSVPIGQTQKQAEAVTGVPAAPSPSQTPLPEIWTAAAAKLQQMECPAHVDPGRWQQVLGDTQRLLDDLGDGWSWAKELAALNWTPQDVFGRDDLDHQSVAWRVKGQEIRFVGSVAITLRNADGSMTRIFRREDNPTGDAT